MNGDFNAHASSQGYYGKVLKSSTELADVRLLPR